MRAVPDITMVKGGVGGNAWILEEERAAADFSKDLIQFAGVEPHTAARAVTQALQ